MRSKERNREITRESQRDIKIEQERKKKKREKIIEKDRKNRKEEKVYEKITR